MPFLLLNHNHIRNRIGHLLSLRFILGMKSNWFKSDGEALLPFEWEKDSNFTMNIEGSVTGDGCSEIGQVDPTGFNVKAGTVRLVLFRI